MELRQSVLREKTAVVHLRNPSLGKSDLSIGVILEFPPRSVTQHLPFIDGGNGSIWAGYTRDGFAGGFS